MKPSVIAEMTTEEIRDKIEEDSSMLSKLKINHAVSQLENPLKIKHLRRTIARLKTEQNKRMKQDQANSNE